MQNQDFFPTMLDIFLIEFAILWASHTLLNNDNIELMLFSVKWPNQITKLRTNLLHFYPFWKCNVDAPLEPLLNLNNVNHNLPMEKRFLNLRLFNVWAGFKRGAAAKIFKRGGKVIRGHLIIILKRSTYWKKGPFLKGGGLTSLTNYAHVLTVLHLRTFLKELNL